jgi:hypothetical protein
MDVIAVREFEYLAPGATERTPARLVLGKPELDEQAWRAPYEIHGIGPEPIVHGSWGDDAVQALLLSMQIVAVHLDRCGDRLTLAGGEGARWDHGLPPRASPARVAAAARVCSWCGKPDGEVELVAGPDADVCEACVRCACAVLGIQILPQGTGPDALPEPDQ